MANEQNLKPIKKGELSSEEAKRRGSAGGKKGAQRKRQKKLLRETIEMMLRTGDTQDNIVAALLQKALDGDTKAFEVIRDTIGQKPDTNINVDGDMGMKIVVDYGDQDESDSGPVQ